MLSCVQYEKVGSTEIDMNMSHIACFIHGK